MGLIDFTISFGSSNFPDYVRIAERLRDLAKGNLPIENIKDYVNNIRGRRVGYYLCWQILLRIILM